VDPHHVNADTDPAFHLNPDPAFHFKVDVDLDPEPAPHQSDGNLRPMVYIDPLGLHLWPPDLHCERPRHSTALF
jgi:hypothetical protein